MSRILMPEYLLNFARDIYEGPLPSNFGERLIDRKDVQVLENWYKVFGGKIPSNQDKRMVPNYLLSFIQKLANADFLEVVDDDVAYIKETPQNALKYAFLNKVGGMSYKSINLWNEIRILNAAILVSSGNSEYSTRFDITDFIELPLITDYCFSMQSLASSAYGGAWFDENKEFIDGFNLNSNTNINIKSAPATAKYVRFTILKDDNACICISNPSHNGKYYPYFEGIRDSLVTSVNDTTLTANEDKYGWGINDEVYNYRDYDENKGHVVVGRVDLGSLNWTYSNGTFRSSGITSPDDAYNLCSIYVSLDYPTMLTTNKSIYVGTNIAQIHDESYDDPIVFKAAMSGVYLYYQLAAETTEDIVAIDNIIDVSNNATFNNEYEQVVPSEITYYVRS